MVKKIKKKDIKISNNVFYENPLPILHNIKLSMPFFIGDQLVNFFINCEDIFKDLKYFKLITKYRIASSGILVSLLSRYIKIKNLKSKSPNGFYIDDDMKYFLNNTKLTFNNHELKKENINLKKTKEPKNIIEKLNTNKNLLDILSQKDKMYNPETNICSFVGIMIICNLFRINSTFLSDVGMKYLYNNDSKFMCHELMIELTKIRNE